MSEVDQQQQPAFLAPDLLALLQAAHARAQEAELIANFIKTFVAQRAGIADGQQVNLQTGEITSAV
jgi:hypothetical protein